MTAWSVCDNPWESLANRDQLPPSRCWLATDATVDSVILLPGQISLPRAGSMPDGRARFEIPAAISRHGIPVERQRFLVSSYGSEEKSPYFERTVDLCIPDGALAEAVTTGDLDPNTRLAIDARDVVTRHFALVNQCCDAQWASGGARFAGSTLSFDAFCEQWNKSSQEEAELALIVRIAEAVSSLIEDLCRSPRRILRRERRHTPVDRVQQVDPACIRWLVRQPGTSIVERAGPRQRILGVVRVEDADTLENRVVRDFMKRGVRACQVYRLANRNFASSTRVRDVLKFQRLMERALRDSDIGAVSQLTAPPEPNYVLMYDDRYRHIWPWYQRLLRQEFEVDNLWRWRHRTWAEIVRSAMSVALHELTHRALVGRNLTKGWVSFGREQQLGQFILPDTRIPLFLRGGDTAWICEIATDLSSAITDERLKRLGSLGPDFVIRCIPLGQPQSRHLLLGIWSEFSSQRSPDEVKRQANSLEQEIARQEIPHACGIFIQPAHRDKDGGQPRPDIDYIGTGQFPTIGFCLPVDHKAAKDRLGDVLDLVLSGGGAG